MTRVGIDVSSAGPAIGRLQHSLPQQVADSAFSLLSQVLAPLVEAEETMAASINVAAIAADTLALQRSLLGLSAEISADGYTAFIAYEGFRLADGDIGVGTYLKALGVAATQEIGMVAGSRRLWQAAVDEGTPFMQSVLRDVRAVAPMAQRIAADELVFVQRETDAVKIADPGAARDPAFKTLDKALNVVGLVQSGDNTLRAAQDLSRADFGDGIREGADAVEGVAVLLIDDPFVSGLAGYAYIVVKADVIAATTVNWRTAPPNPFGRDPEGHLNLTSMYLPAALEAPLHSVETLLNSAGFRW